MEKRGRAQDRIRQIFEYLESLPDGTEAVQTEITKGIGITAGNWNSVKSWLNHIIYIQSQPTLERKFYPLGKKNFKTTYRLVREPSEDLDTYPEV